MRSGAPDWYFATLWSMVGRVPQEGVELSWGDLKLMNTACPAA